MDGWMDGWVDGWMDGWMDGRTDGWMDGINKHLGELHNSENGWITSCKIVTQLKGGQSWLAEECIGLIYHLEQTI